MVIYCDDEASYADLCQFMKQLIQMIRQYENLINAYLLEFYNEDIWNCLSYSWRQFLEPLSHEHLPQLLAGKKILTNQVPPLSLLSFQRCCTLYQISRKPIHEHEFSLIADRIGNRTIELTSDKSIEYNALQSGEYKYIYSRHMKLKKRHEIARYSSFVNHLFDPEQVRLIDFGAGQGHLARLLALHFQFEVVALESEKHNSIKAAAHDQQALRYLSKRSIDSKKLHLPTHLNLHVDKESTNQLPSHPFKQDTVIGLHSCGNLSASMLELFMRSHASYLVLCSCCYHKMDQDCCPLSSFSRTLNMKITYEFKEIACHAQDAYIDRLRYEIEHLRIHCYRAMLESVLAQHFPHLRRSELSKVRHFERLSFPEYARKATCKLPLEFADEMLNNENLQHKLDNYMQVVIFYTIRLCLAGVLETFIHLDRILHLYESQRIRSALVPLFDPKLSPRNFILIARK